MEMNQIANSKFGKRFNFIYTLSVLIFATFILVQLGLWFANKRIGIVYLGVYGSLTIVGMLFALASTLIQGFKLKRGIEDEEAVQEMFFISTTDNERFLSKSPVFKIIAIIAVTFLAIIPLTFLSTVYPVVDYYQIESIEPNQFEQAVVNSVPVGFAEDFGIFILTNIFIFIMAIIGNLFFKIDIHERKMAFFVVVIIASLLSATGNTIVYGFTSAHDLSYSGCGPCKLSAFGHSFITSIAQQVTGVFFFGIPHIAHNFLVSLKFATIFSFALFGAFILIKNGRIRQKNNHNSSRVGPIGLMGWIVRRWP